MKDFQGKVAVVTGTASGIDRGIAEFCAKQGIKVVLADVEEKALSIVETKIKAIGADTLGVVTDVSELDGVQSLAKKAIEAFAKVDLLFNNSGVAAGSSI